MYSRNKKVNFGTPEKPSYPEFPGHLAELRRKHELTQKDLAAMLGTCTDTVSKWERGTVMPRFSVLSAIAVLFGISIPELLGKISDQHYPKGTAKKKWIINGEDLIEK